MCQAESKGFSPTPKRIAPMNHPMILPALTLALFALPSRADEVPSPKPKQATAPLVVVIDDKAGGVRLQVPRALLAELRDGYTPGAAGFSKFPLIVGGVCLAMALAGGGFCLMGRSDRVSVVGVILVLASIVFLSLSAAVAWGDDASTSQPAGVPLKGIPLVDRATIEVIEKGDAITLIVPREHLARVLEQVPPPKQPD